MQTPDSRWRRWSRGRGRWAAALAALVVLAGAGTWTAAADDSAPAVQRKDRMMRVDGVSIDTSYFTSGVRSAGPPC